MQEDEPLTKLLNAELAHHYEEQDRLEREAEMQAMKKRRKAEEMAQEALLAASRAKAEEEAAQKAQQELAKEAAANAELAKRRQAEQEIAAARDAENAAREAANRATFELMAAQKAAQPPDEMETQIEDPEMEELRKLEEQNALLEAEVTARRVLAERQEKERCESEKQRRRL